MTVALLCLSHRKQARCQTLSRNNHPRIWHAVFDQVRRSPMLGASNLLGVQRSELL